MKKLWIVVLLFVHCATGQIKRVVPACPKGATERTWLDDAGDRHYACEAPGKKTNNGQDACYEWEDLYWNPEPGLPCGSSVGNVTDKEYLHALKTCGHNGVVCGLQPVKKPAFVDPPVAPANLARDNPNGDAVFLVVSSSVVTVGNTDANGYRFNEGPPLQRVVGRFADGGTVDLLCFGAVLSRGLDGYTQHEGACPRLQVGERYLMKVGRTALYYERPGGDSVNWQVLEVCSGVGKPDPYGMNVAGRRGGSCQQVSTVNDR